MIEPNWEQVAELRKLFHEINWLASWNDICAELADLRGAAMVITQDLHIKYIHSIPSTAPPSPQPKLTTDDI